MSEVVQPIAYLSVIAFMVLGLFGVRSSIRLTRLYRGAREQIDERNRPVLSIIVTASWMITAAALWIGTLSVVRVLTATSFPWTPPITLVVAIAIIAIPIMFDRAIARVANGNVRARRDLAETKATVDRIEGKVDVIDEKIDTKEKR